MRYPQLFRQVPADPESWNVAFEVHFPRSWKDWDRADWLHERSLSTWQIWASPFGGYVWTYYPEDLHRYW